jgi:hypothetical protein
MSLYNASSDKVRLSYDTVDKKITLNNQTISDLIGCKTGIIDEYSSTNLSGTATISNKQYNFLSLTNQTVAKGDIGIFIKLVNGTKQYVLLGLSTGDTQAMSYDGTVVTYTPSTGLGTATVLGISSSAINFTNGTGTFLQVGDDIVVLSLRTTTASPDTYVAIGITQRAGAITPVAQPVGTLDPTTPLTTSTLPNPFYAHQRDDFFRVSTDYNNYLGQGIDTILGNSTASATGAIRGLSRNLATSFDLGVPPGGFLSDYVVFSDGRLVTFGTGGLYVRDPALGTWTTYNFGGAGVNQVTTDFSNGWIWVYTAGASASAGGPFWSFSVNDTAPVARGQLNTALVNGTLDTTVRIAADNGKLCMQFSDATPWRFHTKNSNDNGNFTYSHILGSPIISQQGANNVKGLQVPGSSDYYYLSQYTASTPDEVAINVFNYSTGVTTSYLTGIEWSGTLLRPYGYDISTGGHHVITCVRNDAGTNRLSLATNNLVTTQYVYTYTGVAPLAEDRIGAPTEVQPNVYYFAAGDVSSSTGGFANTTSLVFGVTLT